MKSIITSHLFILLIRFSLSSQVDFPFKEEVESDIDLDNMLEFSKNIELDYTNERLNRFHDGESISMENNCCTRDYQKNQEKNELLRDQVNQYMKRYINLFLMKCGLEIVPETEDDIEVILSFVIKKEDLLFLHGLTKNLSLKKLQDNLEKVDKILEGLELKQENFFEFSALLNDIFVGLRNSYWYSPKIFYYTLITVITLLVVLILNWRGYSNIYPGLIILNNYIILEGIMDYFNKLEEAETEDFVKMMNAKNIPDACDPNKKSIWSSFTEFFLGDSCLNYHMEMVKTKKKEISPLMCIMDAYNNFVISYPFKVLGSGIRIFNDNLNESMPLQWFFKSGTNWLIIVLIFICIISLFKSRIKFNLFGFGLEMDNSRSEPVPANNFERIEKGKIYEIRSDRRDISGEVTEDEREDGARSKVEDSNSAPEKCIESISEKESPPERGEEGRDGEVKDAD